MYAQTEIASKALWAKDFNGEGGFEPTVLPVQRFSSSKVPMSMWPAQ